jgi:tetratricopeptide (TPR) repeat protein
VMFSELGFPGLALFALAITGCAAGALQARRLGPSAAVLATGALAAAAYWLAHASLDWFWNYPALTAPVFMLLGAACAPSLLDPESARRRRRRWPAALALGAAVVVAGTAYLSHRYVDNANGEWRTDLAGAYHDLDRAEALTPLDERPALSEAVIARAAGDTPVALAATREVVDRQPDSWAGHLLLGELLAPTDPAAARAELERAIELNPDDSRGPAILAQLDG